jgi:hypothetical protein
VVDQDETAEAAERAFRQLLASAGLRQPDVVQPRASGGITCLWYEEKLAVIITDEEEIDCATL